MKEDEDHLRLLALFHYILAGLSVCFSCFPLMYVGFGIAMISGAFPEEGRKNPPEFFGWMFIAIGVVGVLFVLAYAVCLFLAARFLQRRTAYYFCIVIAGISCLNMPFGTCLGIFTIIVLMRPSVKALFERPAEIGPPNDNLQM